MRVRGLSVVAAFCLAVWCDPAAAARTIGFAGVGFGAPDEGEPQGSVNFTAGVMRQLPGQREAIGLEVSYQDFGDDHSWQSGQSVIPVTMQVYSPIGVNRHRMAYLTVGGGAYVWHHEYPVYTLFQPAVADGFAPGPYTMSDDHVSGGFNAGVGIKSRTRRGTPSVGVDLRYHGLWPHGYLGLWTAGARLYF